MNFEQFKHTFLEEAADYLEQIEKGLLLLEENSDNEQAVNDIFRGMHSLKGGGGMFGFERISSFTHDMESLYDSIREGKLRFTNKIASVTFAAVDIIREMLENDDKPSNEHAFEELLQDIRKISGAKCNNQQSIAKKRKQRDFHIHFLPNENALDNGVNPLYMLDELGDMGQMSVRANIEKLPQLELMDPEKCYLSWEIDIKTEASEEEIREVFLFVEDDAQILIEEKQEQQPKSGLSRDINMSEKQQEVNSIKVASSKIDMLNNLMGELVTYDSQFSLLASQIENPELTALGEQMKKLIDQLKDLTFQISLVPLDIATLRFERLVRDLATEQGKRIRFRADGTDTQLDKTIVEMLMDPVMHIIRNAISHGIENEEERTKAGKSAEGNILFQAYYSGANVRIDIRDDGRGFDMKKIRHRAIEQKLLNEDDNLSRDELLKLTFKAGFSTADDVSGLAGRGVGMDVLKKNLESIHGEVLIDSEYGKGSTISLIIPLTLSIVEGLLVKVDDIQTIIPVGMVERIESVKGGQLRNGSRLMSLKKESIPLLPLFFNPDDNDEDRYLPVVVVETGPQKYGLVVKELLGQHQTVLKPLGNYLKMKDEFSGGTVLGDGSIAFVLDVRKFLKYRKDQVKEQYQ